MKVEFIKDHPAGIKKGRVTKTNKNIALRWLKEGYVKAVDKSDQSELKKLAKDQAIAEDIEKNGEILEEKVLSDKEIKELTKEAE